MIRVRNFFPGSLSHSSISSKVGLPTFPAEIQAVSASESSAAILSPASDRSSAAATVINAPRSRWGFSHCHSASSMLSASSSLVFICLTASSKTALLPLLLFTQILPQHSPRMHIIVAMAAEVLPVGAVRRIVVVVPVTVMDSQEMSIRLIELPGAWLWSLPLPRHRSAAAQPLVVGASFVTLDDRYLELPGSFIGAYQVGDI